MRGGQTIQNTYDALNRLTLHVVPQPLGSAAIQTACMDDIVTSCLSPSEA